MESGHAVGVQIRDIRKHRGDGPAKNRTDQQKGLTNRMNLREQAVS